MACEGGSVSLFSGEPKVPDDSSREWLIVEIVGCRFTVMGYVDWSEFFRCSKWYDEWIVFAKDCDNNPWTKSNLTAHCYGREYWSILWSK